MAKKPIKTSAAKKPVSRRSLGEDGRKIVSKPKRRSSSRRSLDEDGQQKTSMLQQVDVAPVSKYLKPTTDIAFKKLFGTQERVNLTKDFLNTILEKKAGELIKTLTITDPANLPETIDKKKSYVDVNCIDKAGKKYIIEMQVLNEYDFVERVQYYVSLAISRQLKVGDLYTKLVPVIFVGVLGFDIDPDELEALSHHAIINLKTGRCLLRHLQFHFVELDKFEKTVDQISTPVDKWVYFMKNVGTLNDIPKQLNSKAFIEAFHVLESAQWTDAELDAHREQEYAMGVTRRQQVGAREEGREEGRKEGRKEGREEGREEGRKEEKFAIARKLLKKNIPVDEIVEIAELDIAEVKELKKKI